MGAGLSTPAVPTLDDALDTLVRDVVDYPRPGIVFKDITPLLGDPGGFAATVDALASRGTASAGGPIDAVVGIEARGFIFAAPVALALGVGFVPVRKAGKLPGPTHELSYTLEYGSETLQVHQDALASGARVLVVDDVLATGGTMAATAELVERCGAEVVGVSVVLELGFLSGRDRVPGLSVSALRVVP